MSQLKEIYVRLFILVNILLIIFPVIQYSTNIQVFNYSNDIFSEDISHNKNKLSYDEINKSNSLIFINKEEDFSVNGFSGDGTEINPFLLANLVLTNDSFHICIFNTTNFFVIDNVSLNGISKENNGIYLHNVQNGLIINSAIKNFYFGICTYKTSNIKIKNCVIFDNINIGIYTDSSNENNYENNTLYNNKHGFSFSFAFGINISNCLMYNNSRHGIHCLFFCALNRFTDNIIYYNGGCGFFADTSVDYNFIINNTVFSNSYDGIHIRYQSDLNIVTNNTIFTNNKSGIRLASTSRANIIDSNIISNNNETGIKIDVECYFAESHTNKIINNTIIGNTIYAIDIEKYSYSNLIIWNYIQGNEEYYENETLVLDNGLVNTYAFNYWHNHNDIDQDNDGVIDKPHNIHGNASSVDNYPTNEKKLVKRNFLTEIAFFNPSNGVFDIFWFDKNDYRNRDNEIPILWQNSISSQKEETYYSLYLSNDNGYNWKTIVTDIPWLNYFWNLDNISSGEYIIKIEAKCESGLHQVQISKPFWIWNGIATLTKPEIILPTTNNTTFNSNEIIELSWNTVYNRIDHNSQTKYSIYITDKDNSQIKLDECTLIVSNLSKNSYNLSLSNFKSGVYQIIILAECGDLSITNSPYLIIEIIKSRKNEFSSYLVLLFSLFILKRTKKLKKCN